MSATRILVLNAGSSSIKAVLYQLDAPPSLDQPAASPLWRAQADWGRHPYQADLEINNQSRTLNITAPRDVIAPLIESLWKGPDAVLSKPSEIAAVGHRVVHGGRLRNPKPATADVQAEIQTWAQHAPEHNPLQLEVIKSATQLLSANPRPQIAVFDTAFHATIPEPAATYPGPYEWIEQGIRRFGFHGISHHYVAHRAAAILNRPIETLDLITCHLGNGCSLCAIHHGRSIDTTMGFTPLEGLMMGTRSGSIDPGILIHLVRNNSFTAPQLDRTLNKQSGLLGISGISGDFREVESAAAQGNPRAQLAIDIFIHRLCREIGAMLASLGRADALVFTGGIGEHATQVRARVCRQLAPLGALLDPDQNQHTPTDADLSAPNATLRPLLIHTDEQWAIACQVWPFANA